MPARVGAIEAPPHFGQSGAVNNFVGCKRIQASDTALSAKHVLLGCPAMEISSRYVVVFICPGGAVLAAKFVLMPSNDFMAFRFFAN